MTYNPELPTLMNSATLNWITPQADEVIAFSARHSSPKNQARMSELLSTLNSTHMHADNGEQAELVELTINLINFCMTHGHFSILEQAEMSVFVRTTRAIAPQFLRHNSARFQEFSQRYAKVIDDIPMPTLRVVNESGRKRDPAQRGKIARELLDEGKRLLAQTQSFYNHLLEAGVHPESARFFLPLATPTVFTMTANLRDWCFYLKSRLSEHAQFEHRLVAIDICSLLEIHAPLTYQAIEPIIYGEN